MTAALLFLSTAVTFLVVDLIGINLLIRPVVYAEAGAIFLDGFRALPAILFYISYMAGLFHFVTAPATRNGDALKSVFLSGAGFGFVCYATYEFTNMATLTAWSWRIVLVDLPWGTFLTGFSAAVGVWITRKAKI